MSLAQAVARVPWRPAHACGEGWRGHWTPLWHSVVRSHRDSCPVLDVVVVIHGLSCKPDGLRSSKLRVGGFKFTQDRFAVLAQSIWRAVMSCRCSKPLSPFWPCAAARVPSNSDSVLSEHIGQRVPGGLRPRGSRQAAQGEAASKGSQFVLRPFSTLSSHRLWPPSVSPLLMKLMIWAYAVAAPWVRHGQFKVLV